MSWIYHDEPLEEMPEGIVSFVYKIEIAGYIYIGKKNTTSTRKKPFGKKELAQVTDARKKKYHMITKPSKWETYCSSSDEVKKLVGAGNVPTRTILRMCESIKEASYFENKYLYEVFGNRNCLNMNVSGNYYLDEVKLWRGM